MNVRPGRFPEFTGRVDDPRVLSSRGFQGFVQEVEGSWFWLNIFGSLGIGILGFRVWGLGILTCRNGKSTGKSLNPKP